MAREEQEAADAALAASLQQADQAELEASMRAIRSLAADNGHAAAAARDVRYYPSAASHAFEAAAGSAAASSPSEIAVAAAARARRWPVGVGSMGLGGFSGPRSSTLLRQEEARNLAALYEAYDSYDSTYYPGDEYHGGGEDVGHSYEELLALDENIVRPSLDAHALDAYTTTQRVADAQAGRLGACVICMDEFAAGDEARRLPCLCLFHKHCIDRHLEGSVTCPICRHDVRESHSRA
jgi:hypothetical protein